MMFATEAEFVQDYITQSRVRTLKERKELKYPCKGFDWRTSFSDSVKNAKYDEADHYVKILIQDVNVLNEARHFIVDNTYHIGTSYKVAAEEPITPLVNAVNGV